MTAGDRLVAWAASAGLTVIRALGPVAASNVCGAVARTVGPWLAVSRVADANLRAALPALPAPARAAVIRGVWDNLGRVVGEFPHLGKLGMTPRGPGIEAAGLENLPRAGEPAILVSAHFGNWEVLPRIAALRGVRQAMLYRAAKNPAVERVIQATRARASGGAPAFPKGAGGARGALRHLAEGGVLCLLMDQKMNDGIEARFFGRPAMTAPAAAALALRFRCPVIPVRCERLAPARWRVTVEPALPPPATGDRHRDLAALTQAINDRIETWVRARPDHWLWLHRRWPRAAISSATSTSKL